jgi:predicted ATPase
VAGRERDRFADGAWLAELAPLADGGSVAPAVAAALQMQQRHATTIEQTVVEYFATRSLLLVLDNCEHVLDAAARLVQRIVAECPRRRRARHEPGAARRRRRAGVAGAAAPAPGRRHPVRAARAGHPPRLRARRRRGRRDLPTARRPAARHRDWPPRAPGR